MTRKIAPDAQTLAPPRSGHEIAIVGYGMRLPRAHDLDEFWALLAGKIDAVTEVPASRFDVSQWYHPKEIKKGYTISKWGSFLDGLELFDPAPFRISTLEAPHLDPQQRLALEVSWEALERAGIAPDSVVESSTGVFIGSLSHDFERMHLNSPATMGPFGGTGTNSSLIANRVSYVLGLRGPSVSLDTACSSSLTAIHLACASLRDGDCDLAIAGGVNVLLTPDVFIGMSQSGAISPTGRCRPFDASADGYVRGEGCGVVLLEPLDKALRHGRHIYAVISASSINQDGATNGITAPSSLAQRDLIRASLARAGITGADIGYVEAHGTGTPLGDPIEIVGLNAALNRPKAAEPCFVGSVKSNIGHLEAAAGIASVLKVLAIFDHDAIPGTLHFKTLNPKIRLDDTSLRIADDITPWPRKPGHRYASISAFGFGGSNAHLILRDAGADERATVNQPPRPILRLSARSPASLKTLAAAYARFVQSTPADLGQVIAAANVGRAALPHRAAVASGDKEKLVAGLQAIASGSPGPAVFSGVQASRAPKVAFLFAGQGAQRPRMARDLLQFERFRQTIERGSRIIDPIIKRSIGSLLTADSDVDALSQTAITQPLLYLFEYALADLLIYWGLVPKVVMGHSIGEIAAAAIAEVFSFEDGCEFAVTRGSLMQGLPTGAMLSIAASPSRLPRLPDGCDLAAANSPQMTVVAGPGNALERFKADLEQAGISSTVLKVSHAFHSAMMDPVLDQIEAAAARMDRQVPRVPIISTVTGKLEDRRIAEPQYWRDQARQAVLFSAAVRAAEACGVDAFLEIGPDRTLSALGPASLQGGQSVIWQPALRREEPGDIAITRAIARLYCAGCDFDWSRIHESPSGALPRLPTYAFEKAFHWDPPPVIPSVTAAPMASAGHPLLGNRIRTALPGTIFENIISLQRQPFLGSHRIGGSVLFPGAGFVEMAVAAANDIAGSSAFEVRGLEIREALILGEGNEKLVQTVVVSDDGIHSVRIFSTGVAADKSPRWILHASCQVRTVTRAPSRLPVDIAALADSCPASVRPKELYESLDRLGLAYGADFRLIEGLRISDRSFVATISLGKTGSRSEKYIINPALLDASFHAIASLVSQREQAFDSFVIVGIEDIRIFQTLPENVLAFGEVAEDDGEEILSGLVHLMSVDGVLVAVVSGVKVRPLRKRTKQSLAPDRLLPGWAAHPLKDTAEGVASPSFALSGDEEVIVPILREGQKRGLSVSHSESEKGHSVFVMGGSTSDHLSTLTKVLLWLQAQIANGRKSIWIVSHGGSALTDPSISAAAVLGLVRAAKLERPGILIRSIDLESSVDEADAAVIWDEIQRAPVNETEVAYQGGVRRTARITAHRSRGQVRGISIASRGTLDGLSFSSWNMPVPGKGDVVAEVRASGLNFRDVLNVLGSYPGDPGPVGLEFAGVVIAIGPDVEGLEVGDAVFGIARQTIATHVVAHRRLIVKKPECVSFIDAATLPVAFITAVYGLKRLANIAKGDTVLVHAGAGGVGMAAIQIARDAGARVIATASEAKWAAVRALGVEAVFSSRSADFAEKIESQFGERSIDVALNSLTGEMLENTLRLMKRNGRFLEVGKAQILSAKDFDERAPGCAYRVFDIGELCRDQPDEIQRMLSEIVDRVIDRRLQPLPRTVYSLDDAVSGFRFMALAKHKGKIVIEPTVMPSHIGPVISERLEPRRVYLITGGYGALGFEIAKHLHQRGATHIALLGRGRAAADGRDEIERLRGRLSELLEYTGDVSDAASLAAILADLERRGLKIGGVVHAAGVLADSAIERQTADHLSRAVKPKIDGAENLARALENVPYDFVVLFSSVAGVFGSPGQAAYAAANAGMDAIATREAALGRPWISIAWGPWGAVGMAAQQDDALRSLWARLGINTLSVSSALAAFDDILRDAYATEVVVAANWSLISTATPALGQLCKELAPPPPPRVAPIAIGDVADRLRFLIRKVLGLSAEDPLSETDPLPDLGIDSLTALELKNQIGQEFGDDVPFEILLGEDGLGGILSEISRMRGSVPT